MIQAPSARKITARTPRQSSHLHAIAASVPDDLHIPLLADIFESHITCCTQL